LHNKTFVAVNSTKGASPVSLLAWSDAENPVATVLDNSAEVRVVHAVDSVDVDVFAGGELLEGAFNYKESIGYLKVVAGSLDVAVAPAGQGVGNAIPSLSGTLDLQWGESYTVIAADGTTTAAVPGTAGLELAAGSITTALAIGADGDSLEPLLLDDKR
jgi:hypothetical protein